jgi:hypothetical protein
MHNVIALREIIDLQKATINQFPLHCFKIKLIGKENMPNHIVLFYNYLQRQKIDLQKKICQSSSFSFRNYLQNLERNNFTFNKFLINMSYLALISLRYLLIPLYPCCCH